MQSTGRLTRTLSCRLPSAARTVKLTRSPIAYCRVRKAAEYQARRALWPCARSHRPARQTVTWLPAAGPTSEYTNTSTSCVYMPPPKNPASSPLISEWVPAAPAAAGIAPTRARAEIAMESLTRCISEAPIGSLKLRAERTERRTANIRVSILARSSEGEAVQHERAWRPHGGRAERAPHRPQRHHLIARRLLDPHLTVNLGEAEPPIEPHP